MENSFLQSIVDYFNDRENGTVLQTPDFSIVHNVLEFSDLIVQISSIASVSVAKPVKNKIPKWLTYAIMIGVILLALKNSVGYIILGICAFFLYCIYESNKDLGMNLIFELNSGKFLYINVEDKAFAQKVINVLRDCMNGANKPLTINFDKMNIVDSNIIMGNENVRDIHTYDISGNNNNVSVQTLQPEFEWARLEQDLKLLIENVNKNTIEYKVLLTLLSSVYKKDKKTFTQTVKEHAFVFSTNVISNFASDFLKMFINSL